MLSTENPPPDPAACPCKISQLKICVDERASDEQEEVVDLLKSDLDENKSPEPKFSIRDYVFSTRSKDIKNNWPFSQKNLQLCLKHGVTNLLPPFQPLDLMRNQTRKRCAVESSSLDNETLSIPHGEPSRLSHNPMLVSPNDAGCSQSAHINSSASEGEKEFSSKTSIQSDFGIDSVPTNRSPCFELETDTLFRDEKVEAAVPPASKNVIRALPKKCKLIVKLRNVANPSSNEASTPINSMVSEPMASKVCPVCKIFSSSSNTTLNAHIDQCLSGESNVRWTSNCNVIKHRIKSRKMRMMVDIYATAKHCTLEELDRRNGTSWATNSNFPAQEIELCADEKEQSALPVNLEVAGNEGGVYIDANGTKLRILSKFSTVTPADPEALKPLKGGNVKKFLSTKKKKHHSPTHHKFLKLNPLNKAFRSPKTRSSSKVHCGQESVFAAKDRYQADGHLAPFFKAKEQVDLIDPGFIRRWVGSKRSGLTKKTSVKDDHQCSQNNATQDLLVESNQSPLGVLNTPISSENPFSSPACNKKMEIISYEPPVDESSDKAHPRKKCGFSLLCSRVDGDGKRSPALSKQTLKLLRKDGLSALDCCKGHRSNWGKHLSSSNKEVEMNSAPPERSDSFVIDSQFSSCHFSLSLEGGKLSSVRKNPLPDSGASESKSKFKRKCSVSKKSRVHSISALYKDAVASPSHMDQLNDLIQIDTEKQSLGRSCVRKIRKKRGVVNTSNNEPKDEAMALKSLSPLAAKRHGHDVPGNIDSSMGVNAVVVDTYDDVEPVGRDAQIHGKDTATKPPGSNVGGSYMSLSNSLNPEFQELASPPEAQYDLLHGIDVYKGPFYGAETVRFPNEASHDGQGITETELDSTGRPQIYLPEVDPIVIPGPPGSFLPSPRDMGSDDLQGNSSLTTSVAQSSEDNNNLIDRDSSESPISATSTVSSSAAARSDSKFSLPEGPHAVKDVNRPGFSGAHVDPMVEAVNLGAEKINPDDLRASASLIEKGPLGFKNDRPCCCSRKEPASQSFALNYQDSQLLRRRTAASVPHAAIGKQMSCDRSSSLSTRSEYYPLSSYQDSEIGKVTSIPAMKSPVGQVAMKVSVDSDVKFPIGGDYDSASPSVSNSVLRLMGKNLTVVNKDGDVSPKLGEAQSQTMNENATKQFCMVSGGSVKNEGCNSVNRVVSRGPTVFSQTRRNPLMHPFDAGFSNSSSVHVDFKKPEAPPHASEIMFSGKHVASCFTAFSERHKYKIGSNLHSEYPLAYNMEKIVPTPAPQHGKGDSASNPGKEIIIIDDTPESVAKLASDATFNIGVIKGWGSSAGISVPNALESKNCFYGYQPPFSPPYGGSVVVHNTGFQTLPSRGANAAGPFRWNCAPEGTGMLQRSSLTSSSSPTCHQASAVYYSPSFS